MVHIHFAPISHQSADTTVCFTQNAKMMDFLKTVGEQARLEEQEKKQAGERRKADTAVGEVLACFYWCR